MRAGSDWRKRYSAKLVSAEAAVADIRRGQRVFIGSGAAEPQALVAARAERGRPVIALPSTALVDGQRLSRIAPILKPGAGVVTSALTSPPGPLSHRERG